MSEMLSISQAAVETNARSPKDISRLFYEGALRTDLCPVIAGRRLIPREYLPMIAMTLKRRGLVRAEVQS